MAFVARLMLGGRGRTQWALAVGRRTDRRSGMAGSRGLVETAPRAPRLPLMLVRYVALALAVLAVVGGAIDARRCVHLLGQRRLRRSARTRAREGLADASCRVLGWSKGCASTSFRLSELPHPAAAALARRRARGAHRTRAHHRPQPPPRSSCGRRHRTGADHRRVVLGSRCLGADRCAADQGRHLDGARRRPPPGRRRRAPRGAGDDRRRHRAAR
jgi:hypothetical protein